MGNTRDTQGNSNIPEPAMNKAFKSFNCLNSKTKLDHKYLGFSDFYFVSKMHLPNHVLSSHSCLLSFKTTAQKTTPPTEKVH